MLYYFAYIYGCNKVAPKLILVSQNLEKIIENLIENSNSTSFDDILDKEIMEKYNNFDECSNESFINSYLLHGPAFDSEIGKDYIIKYDKWTKLIGESTCLNKTCFCGLTIFEKELNENNIIKIPKFEKKIFKFIN